MTVVVFELQNYNGQKENQTDFVLLEFSELRRLSWVMVVAGSDGGGG